MRTAYFNMSKRSDVLFRVEATPLETMVSLDDDEKISMMCPLYMSYYSDIMDEIIVDIILSYKHEVLLDLNALQVGEYVIGDAQCNFTWLLKNKLSKCDVKKHPDYQFFKRSDE